MYSVLVELQHQCGVREAILQVLPYFNQELDKKTPYKLAQDPDQFELYSAKRNGQAKMDYPGNRSFSQKLSYIREYQLSLPFQCSIDSLNH